MDSESSTMAKNTRFEQMEKRDRERKQANEKNQRERQNKAEHEGINYFDSVFDKKASDIENRLNDMQPNNDTTELQAQFTSIGKDLQDLQKYFTSSTIFLNDYRIKTCQNVINQLVLKSDETKSRIMPKKKFGFKNKTAAPKSSKVETAKADDVSKEQEKKEFQWTDSSKRGEVLRFSDEKVNNQDLTFKELENCVIFINGHAGSLQMLKLKNCLVLCGAVSRSVFADDCENCVFAFACQQLRLHSSKMCSIYIYVTSRAIIEDCQNINFAPNTFRYENYDEDLKLAGLDSNVNNWENVGDFNWLSTDMPSPNWNKIKDDEKINDWTEMINNFIKTHNISTQ